MRPLTRREKGLIVYYLPFALIGIMGMNIISLSLQYGGISLLYGGISLLLEEILITLLAVAICFTMMIVWIKLGMKGI